MSRIYIGVLLLYFFYGCAMTPSAPQYLLDQETGCKIRNPYIYEQFEAQWSGTCNDGIAEGPGTITWYDQNRNQVAYLRTCIDSANYTCSKGGMIPSGMR